MLLTHLSVLFSHIIRVCLRLNDLNRCTDVIRISFVTSCCRKFIVHPFYFIWCNLTSKSDYFSQRHLDLFHTLDNKRRDNHWFRPKSSTKEQHDRKRSRTNQYGQINRRQFFFSNHLLGQNLTCSFCWSIFFSSFYSQLFIDDVNRRIWNLEKKKTNQNWFDPHDCNLFLTSSQRYSFVSLRFYP